MVALHYLKYRYDLSDDVVLAQWLENPYWQHFSGRQFFEHEMPIHPSSMTRWRKRLGEAGAEAMLKATIDTGLKMKVITPAQIERVKVDPTVQTKAVRFPAFVVRRGIPESVFGGDVVRCLFQGRLP